MSSPEFADIPEFARMLAKARAGSADALGGVFMNCREYLLMLAQRQLAPDLQAKISPSDIVQETFLEAQRDFAQFHGDRADELLAWMCRILVNNLANVGRDYRDAQKRAVDREVPIVGCRNGRKEKVDVSQDTPTPSGHLAAHEEAARVQAALVALPEHHRQVVHLRYDEKQTFAQIGEALNCSAEAARKLWARAIDRLQKLLELPNEP